MLLDKQPTTEKHPRTGASDYAHYRRAPKKQHVQRLLLKHRIEKRGELDTRKGFVAIVALLLL